MNFLTVFILLVLVFGVVAFLGGPEYCAAACAFACLVSMLYVIYHLHKISENINALLKGSQDDVPKKQEESDRQAAPGAANKNPPSKAQDM